MITERFSAEDDAESIFVDENNAQQIECIFVVSSGHFQQLSVGVAQWWRGVYLFRRNMNLYSNCVFVSIKSLSEFDLQYLLIRIHQARPKFARRNQRNSYIFHGRTSSST